MKYRHVMNRRTFLKGSGSIAIGLPFLEAMHCNSVWGQGTEPPMRAITFFFGLGLHPEQMMNGLTDGLSPLAPFSDKIGYSRNLNLGTSTSAANHDEGSRSIFRGVGTNGATIDQFILDKHYNGESPTAIRSLMAGTFSRNNGKRENHSYRANGAVTDTNYRIPQELFTRIFGSFNPDEPPSDDPPPPIDAEDRIARSVLDSVTEQYKYLSSDAGKLGAASRAQLSDHLDRVRELELSVFGEEVAQAVKSVEGALASCSLPDEPRLFNDTNFDALQGLKSGDGDVGQSKFPIDWQEWDLLWKALIDTYAMGITCDRFRFGNLQFTSGGERLSVVGDYSWGGRDITFNDPTTTHEYWHGWGANAMFDGVGSREMVARHTHLIMSRAAYFMQKMDAAIEGNGKSILENMLFMMGTELGDGSSSHSLKDIFHLWTGAGNRLKVGAAVDFNEMDCKRFYSTIAEALVGDDSMTSERPDDNSRALLVAG